MAPSDAKQKAYAVTALKDIISVQFNFAIKDIDIPVPLTTSGLTSVSDAIQKDRITVLSMSKYGTTAQADAAYRNDHDTMYIPDDYVSRSPGDRRTYDYGAVIHEAVHAYFDLMAVKHLTYATAEVAAYLVAALYYQARHYNVKPANDTFTLVLLEAARLTAKVKASNVTLSRADFKDLRDAVVTHYKKINPSYRGDTIMSLGIATP